MATIVPAQVAHAPTNPFVDEHVLQAFVDGAVAFADGRIVACGVYGEVRDCVPGASVVDARDAVLLPGFVDCHVHFPQIRVIGALGLGLMDWLRSVALPEERRLADAAGLRIISGLVLSDRNLLPELHTTPPVALHSTRELIDRWHGRGLIRYAISPRFSVSCSDELLSACGELAREVPGLLVSTHINETVGEIELVASLFGSARDYLETYERYGLVGHGSVFAHDVHVGESELRRLAEAGPSVAHCPSSNAFLGAVFTLAREESIAEVWVAGEVVFAAPGAVG